MTEDRPQNSEDRFDHVFDIALVLLGVFSGAEAPFFIRTLGEAAALKAVIAPLFIIIIVWLAKELFKNRLSIGESLLYSEFCWEIWSLSLAYYLAFFYLNLMPTIPTIAILTSVVIGLGIYAAIAVAYFLEYRQIAREYYRSRRWLLAKLAFLLLSLIVVYFAFSSIPTN